MSRVVSVGEVMVELARGKDGRFGLAYGGDTFNTAIYLARLGVETAYATALGDDPYSEAIVALAAGEGVATDLVGRVAGRMPGLYLIETDKGERRFYYWRDTSPARQLFELDGWGGIAEGITAARLVYVSGITLSLYSNTGLGRLLATLEVVREKGGKVAFDGNFRPRGWRGDVGRARAVFQEALRRSDIALPTFEDEQMLFEDASPEATVERLASYGVKEVVVKNGAGGALVAADGERIAVPVDKRLEPVDTTAAGDSFNAAYLAARLAGSGAAEAARAGHRLAGEVIMHPGAIMPRKGANGAGTAKH